jgi:DNA-binding HxlR family transcriptional regulator
VTIEFIPDASGLRPGDPHSPAPQGSSPHSIDDGECRRLIGSVELIGKRWSAGIMLAMTRGATRFSEIAASVSALSDRLLAQRLRELESVSLIEREVIASTPVQVRYRLTESGADLMRSLQPLSDWGQRWRSGDTP